MSTQKEELRAQLDHRKGSWKIVKKTLTKGKGSNPNGTTGWRRFGDSWYLTRQDAEDAIKRIINNYPGMYQEG